MGRAFVDRQPVHVADIEADTDYDPRTLATLKAVAPYRTVLGIPILKDGVAIGAIGCARRDVKPFSEAQIALVKSFADQAVIAIENARLFDEVHARTRDLQEALEYQTATSQILGVISSSRTDLQRVMDSVAESAARMCAANDALIFRVDGDVLRITASYGIVGITDGARIHGQPLTKGTVTGRAVVERRTVHVPDLATALEAEYPDAKPYQQQLGHRTTLATPLLKEGVPLGAILIRRMEVNPFTDKQIALLEAFADQAVIAIENARLFEAEQASTQEVTEFTRIPDGDGRCAECHQPVAVAGAAGARHHRRQLDAIVQGRGGRPVAL